MFFHTLEDIVSPRKKHPEELVYLGNKEIYWICRTCCISSLNFPQNAISQIYLSLSKQGSHVP